MINFVPFSKKQRQILNWWHPNSPVNSSEGLIADGAIRSGKTLPMALSFISFAFCYFNNESFGMAGKTVGSFRRNVWQWLKPVLLLRGYGVDEIKTENKIVLSRNGKTNTFYVFGGRDESSQDLVQGVTLAGFLFDEVALMPESFVNQATGRCSVTGSKFFFNCNPEGPAHFFKVEWLDKAKEKNLIHLHFTMDNNPSLAESIKQRYRNMYPFMGVFYKRYILGLWAIAEGAIYDMWSDDNLYDELPLTQGERDQCLRYIAVDYGTTNPMVFLDVYDTGEGVYVEREYYWDSKKEYRQKTDAQYADDFDAFVNDGGPPIQAVIIDPSAASFRAELRLRGYRIKEADNEVLDGIRITASAIGKRILKVNKRCKQFIREVGSYVWDKKRSEKGNEQPVKANDHAMDAIRYFFKTVFKARRLMGS